MRSRLDLGVLCILLVAVAACAPAEEEIGDLTADDVLREAAEREEARTEGVATIAIVQETFGLEQALRFRRVEGEDGRSGFELVSVSMDGMAMPVDQVETPGVAGSARMFGALIGQAELRRVTRDADRRRVAVLHVADPGEIEGLTDMALPTGEQEQEFEYEELEIQIDLDQYLLRRVESRVRVRDPEGEMQRLTMIMSLEDYREVEGILYPYRTVMRMEGLQEPTAEEREEARGRISMMRGQLEQVPEQHREEAEQFVENQVRMMEQMMEGYMEFEVVTRSVEVERG